MLTCDGAFDDGVDTSDATRCKCKGSSEFDTASNKCAIKCADDNLAEGSDPNSADHCLCKENAEWKKDSLTCECSEGYDEDTANNVCPTLSGGVIAAIAVSSVVVVGVAIFAGVKIYGAMKSSARTV